MALRYDRARDYACVIGFALCFLLRDRPTSMGLPTVGEWRNDIAEKEHESEGLGLSNWEILKIYVFKNSIIWALAFFLVFYLYHPYRYQRLG